MPNYDIKDEYGGKVGEVRKAPFGGGYDIHDKYGGKVGEARPAWGGGGGGDGGGIFALVLLVLALTAGIFLLPFVLIWFIVGKDWKRFGIVTATLVGAALIIVPIYASQISQSKAQAQIEREEVRAATETTIVQQYTPTPAGVPFTLGGYATTGNAVLEFYREPSDYFGKPAKGHLGAYTVVKITGRTSVKQTVNGPSTWLVSFVVEPNGRTGWIPEGDLHWLGTQAR